VAARRTGPPIAASSRVAGRRASADRAGSIACHASQSADNPVLWRRLELPDDAEHLRCLRRRADAREPAGPAAAPAPARPRHLGPGLGRRARRQPQPAKHVCGEAHTAAGLLVITSCKRACTRLSGQGIPWHDVPCTRGEYRDARPYQGRRQAVHCCRERSPVRLAALLRMDAWRFARPGLDRRLRNRSCLPA
jgi:hypothetical protein